MSTSSSPPDAEDELPPPDPTGIRLLPDADAQDWGSQMRRTVRSVQELREKLSLSPEELAGAIAAERAGLPISITPYYLALCDRNDPNCPIRKQVVPHALEGREVEGDLRDPLGEEAHEVAPELVQRYPDRALLLATDRCAIYCRFCTRSRIVGSGGGPRSEMRLMPALEYLRNHPEIRDLIISGGDPLAMSTTRIVRILQAVRCIPSIETIRIATRMPVALPQRITYELIQALRPFHPIWIMTHFNHPKELTAEAREGLRRLVDGGFPVMNHTVLLRGVNDDSATLSELFRGLVRERAKPYYLLQADPVRGTGHLRTPLDTGLRIMSELQGRLSGIALPKFIVDTPGGLGKVPVNPNYIVSRGAGVTRFKTHRGVEVDYFDPPE
ncbi:MAG TPA: KamA family radical SAM protein [Polyangiaceae bacterium]|jgi:lysine 2,3-aminomutase|nr:KamA family radical SAM protein [Polyangiaceae bacterium]